MNRGKKILINSVLVIVAVTVTLIVIEIGMMIAGVPAILSPGFEPDAGPGIICNEETGCFWNAIYHNDDCTAPYFQGDTPGVRHCRMNEAGFFDSDVFVDNGDLRQYRILLLGDSFTFGYTASIGHSWAEVAESQFQDLDVTVWNAGVPGAGTQHAIMNLEHFAPVLNPDLVVLGFYVNDIVDNLFPADNWLVLETGEERGIWVQQYRMNEQLEIEKIPASSLYYRLQGMGVLEFSTLDRLLLSTRTGSFVLPRLAGLQVEGESLTYFSRPDGWYERAMQVTADRIAELNMAVESYDAELLVLVIPDIHILPWHPTVLEDTYAILEANGIPYITVDDMVVPEDYINENPADSHWNDSGHGKAGQRMGTCLRHIILNDTMCLQANVPAPEFP